MIDASATGTWQQKDPLSGILLFHSRLASTEYKRSWSYFQIFILGLFKYGSGFLPFPLFTPILIVL